jgi:hypothetical protein
VRCAAPRRVGQIIGHAGEDVAFLATQIALQLNHGRAPGDVDPAAIVDQIAFMLQLVEGGAEAFAQKLGDETPKRFVTWPRRHCPGDLGQSFSAPSVRHLSPTFQGILLAALRATP